MDRIRWFATPHWFYANVSRLLGNNGSLSLQPDGFLPLEVLAICA